MNTKYIVVAGLFIMASCSKEGSDKQPGPSLPTPAPVAVTADFTVQASAEVGAVVSLQNNSQNATGYKWDFGDGSSVVEESQPQHTYATKGNYTIKLTAYNTSSTVSVTKSLEVAVISWPNLMAKVVGRYRGRLYMEGSALPLTVRDTLINVSSVSGADGVIAIPVPLPDPVSNYFYAGVVAGAQGDQWGHLPQRPVHSFSGPGSLYERSFAHFEQQGDSLYLHHHNYSRGGGEININFYGRKEQ